MFHGKKSSAMISWSTLLVFLPLVSSHPPKPRQGNTICGSYDTLTSHPYSLLTNHWGKSEAASGWQCSTLKSVVDRTATWTTDWQWSGGKSIKSFSSIQLNNGINKQLSEIKSMPSTWSWSQHSTGEIVADVAYDLFTSYTVGGSNANEVMIWLAAFNSSPISHKYDSRGHATPIVRDLGITGHSWNLYEGSNGYNTVYSFLPSNRIHTFEGDIYEFFKYLIQKGYIDASQYLKTAQAGIEATSGTANFKTTAYSLTIN